MAIGSSSFCCFWLIPNLRSQIRSRVDMFVVKNVKKNLDFFHEVQNKYYIYMCDIFVMNMGVISAFFSLPVSNEF